MFISKQDLVKNCPTVLCRILKTRIGKYLKMLKCGNKDKAFK